MNEKYYAHSAIEQPKEVIEETYENVRWDSSYGVNVELHSGETHRYPSLLYIKKEDTPSNYLGKIDVEHRYAVADGALQVQVVKFYPPINRTGQDATDAQISTRVLTVYAAGTWAKVWGTCADPITEERREEKKM